MDRHLRKLVQVKYHIKILLEWQTILARLLQQVATLVVRVQLELKYWTYRPNAGPMHRTIPIPGKK